MKSFSNPLVVLLLTIAFSSCSGKLTPGKYVYKANKSYFEIDENGNYHYSTIGDVHGVAMFSKGKSIFNKGEVNFIPDSSYFFHISVLRYHFDPALIGRRKIILDVPDSILSKFHFSFNNDTASSVINFDNCRFVIYKPSLPSFQDGSLILRAKLADSIAILPRLLHDSITSNSIEFFDVNNNDPNNKPWNVLELNININRDMFAFTTLPSYILKNKRLIAKDCPVYELTKK